MNPCPSVITSTAVQNRNRRNKGLIHMLVLTRKKGQSVMIGHDIEISIIDIQGDQVRIGINAPRSVAVHRKEIYEEIRSENRLATMNARAGIDRLKIQNPGSVAEDKVKEDKEGENLSE